MPNSKSAPPKQNCVSLKLQTVISNLETVSSKPGLKLLRNNRDRKFMRNIFQKSLTPYHLHVVMDTAPPSQCNTHHGCHDLRPAPNKTRDEKFEKLIQDFEYQGKVIADVKVRLDFITNHIKTQETTEKVSIPADVTTISPEVNPAPSPEGIPAASTEATVLTTAQDTSVISLDYDMHELSTENLNS